MFKARWKLSKSLKALKCFFLTTSRVNGDAIVSNEKNIATNYEVCLQNRCASDCENPLCNICLPCADDATKFHMHDSYREHLRMGNFKRIFPSVSHFDDPKLFESVSDINKIMLKWFKAKCEEDKNWCWKWFDRQFTKSLQISTFKWHF